MKEYRSKVFKSGNSLALRLPKGLGLAEGTEMVVREERGEFRFEPVAADVKLIDLTGIYGAGAGLKPLTTDDRVLEPRELDWEGKLLERG